ncbi:hypothetical protein [Microbacterium rhizophilus]|uniref:hypothetical protein n=1 Tax=Microbacterium rhizophilus TaxID=3138934 RepID=UPI0031EF39AB
MIAVEILPVTLPDSVEASDARDFLDYVRIAGTVTREQSGSSALAQDPGEILARLRDAATATWVPLLARIAGRPAGAAQFMAPADGGVLANISVFVPRRDTGILEAMLIKTAEEQARSRWRTALRAVSLHRPGPEGDAIPTASGDGSVPRDPQARALAESGYTLERVSRHPVPHHDLEYLSAEWRKALAV